MDTLRKQPGLVFTLVGPGGVGKNTLMNRVLQRTQNLRQFATVTTRPIRPSEQHGREHVFVDADAFQRLIDQNALLEHQEVSPGKFYGMPRAPIEAAIAGHHDLIADIEVYGATILRKTYPDNAVLVFIAPTSMERLVEQMRERCEDETLIASRMERAQMEMTYAPTCDYVIISDNLDEAEQQLLAMITAKQNGEAATATAIQPGFKAVTWLLDKDERLLHSETLSPLAVPVQAKELPLHTAQRFIKEHFGEEHFGEQAFGLHPEALAYAHPDHLPPIEILYDRSTHLYNVTYHFVYRPPQRVQPPPGFLWIQHERQFA